MLKKIHLALLVSCLSASTFAYEVKAFLTIDNQTDVPMRITVEQPNGQNPIYQLIPAHHVSTVTKSQTDVGEPLDNNMGYLLSLQESFAQFKLMGTGENNETTYLQGRVVYYAGWGAIDKYSFIDNIIAGPGLTFVPSYTCKRAEKADHVFNNKIVITGTPGMPVQFTPDSYDYGYCQGLSSSTMWDDEQHIFKNQYYSPVCMDGKTSTLWRTTFQSCGHGNCTTVTEYTNGSDEYAIGEGNLVPTSKDELDKLVGNRFCGTWPKIS